MKAQVIDMEKYRGQTKTDEFSLASTAFTLAYNTPTQNSTPQDIQRLEGHFDYSYEGLESASLVGPKRSLVPGSDLSPFSEISPQTPLRNAIRNLNEALEYLDNALEAISTGDFVAADDAMIHFGALLPELFCSRSIGDGFGMVINALMIAFRNRGPSPFQETHIRAIRICITSLRNGPRLPISEALSRLEHLESHGLRVHLPELDFLVDLAE